MIEKHFINQAYKNIELEKFFEQKLSKAGFNSLEIIKSPVATRVVVYVAKPGLAIGYSGKNIKYLSSKLEKDYNFKNPHIEVKAVEFPEYDVKHKVSGLINALERGNPWRSVVHRFVSDMSKLNLMGFELLLKGVLMGKGGRKQKYRIALGYMKKVGDQTKLVKMAKGSATTKAGSIGITLKLIPPNTVFPDKISNEDIDEAVNVIIKGMSREELDLSSKVVLEPKVESLDLEAEELGVEDLEVEDVEKDLEKPKSSKSKKGVSK